MNHADSLEKGDTAECQLMSLLMTFACQLSSSTETLEKEGYAQ